MGGKERDLNNIGILLPKLKKRKESKDTEQALMMSSATGLCFYYNFQ